MDIKVCILNYGCGNVRSVYNMLAGFAKNVVISNEAPVIKSATHIVLPGVGAFGSSMTKVKSRIPLDVLEQEVFKRKKPFLGICVGMQILAEKGYEFGEHKGLGWIPGEAVKLNAGGLRLPHIGWNNIKIKVSSAILKQFTDNQDFYFVHSYVFKEKDARDVIAVTDYGEEFCSIVNRGNIFGVQFHPEKSQKAGKILLKNFLELRA